MDFFRSFWKFPAGHFDPDMEGDDESSIRIDIRRENLTGADFFLINGTQLFGRISSSQSASGGLPIMDMSETVISVIEIESASRRIVLPFDPDEVISSLLLEGYENGGNGRLLLDMARRIYYLVKPVMPRKIQLALRKATTTKMGERTYPSWPMDTSVEEFQHFLLELVFRIHKEPIPFIYFWPNAAPFCLVLTHDVELSTGVKNITPLVEIEKRHNLRSAWNFVPKRYEVNEHLLRWLQEDRFEVGVHGLYHDGRLFESSNTFATRAKLINKYLQEWGSVGFRSPSLIRNLDWIFDTIQIEYDSSCINTEYYGAQPGGSCTVFPFIYKDKVELPLTLQEDHTLLEILNLTPEQLCDHWIEQVVKIQRYHGMALVNIHPDYLNTPDRLEAYEQFLTLVCKRFEFWNAVPRDVARWWKNRYISELVWNEGAYEILGPASQSGEIYIAEPIDNRLKLYKSSSNA